MTSPASKSCARAPSISTVACWRRHPPLGACHDAAVNAARWCYCARFPERRSSTNCGPAQKSLWCSPFRCCCRSTPAGGHRSDGVAGGGGAAAGAHPARRAALGPALAVAVAAFGAVTATIGGGDPVVHLWSHNIEVWRAAEVPALHRVSIVLLALGAMVSWTTNVADVAPAVATLGGR